MGGEFEAVRQQRAHHRSGRGSRRVGWILDDHVKPAASDPVWSVFDPQLKISPSQADQLDELGVVIVGAAGSDAPVVRRLFQQRVRLDRRHVELGQWRTLREYQGPDERKKPVANHVNPTLWHQVLECR
jgi:hypothetical protein